MPGRSASDAARVLGTSVARIDPVDGRARRVDRVTLADGRTIAVKRAVEGAPVGPEAAALRYLNARGAPVPVLLATGPGEKPRWIATGWIDGPTLDSALQAAPDQEASLLGHRLATAVAMVEAAFLPLARHGAPVEAQEVSRSLLRPWARAAPAAVTWLWSDDALAAPPGPPARSVAREVAIARASALTVGPLDYHAGNVIVPDADPDRPLVIVDLSATGWDWPARRLAQYAFATGTGEAGGGFRVALDRESMAGASELLAAVHGGRPDRWTRAIDAHLVVLVAMAAAHLRAVANGSALPARAASWHDVDRRREALRAILRGARD